MKKITNALVITIISGQCLFWLCLSILLFSVDARGECSIENHDIDLDFCNIPSVSTANAEQDTCTFGVESGESVMFESISARGFNLANTNWSVTDETNCSIMAGSNQLTCLGILVNYQNSSPVSLNGIVIGDGETESIFTLTASDGAKNCWRKYAPHITSNVGGWGDPHITTVDGTNYDFQSAGEFVALRGNGLEIQARQTPVSTSHVPAANSHTGIASCVSIYTAVAARIGEHRVTIQPNDNEELNSRGLLLRVDGDIKSLGPDGIDLSSCNCPAAEVKSSGRIVRSTDEQSIEIRYAGGAKLVVTPAWWNAHKKWYLNINVYDTTATDGIMGRIAKESWLPALSDGASVGPMSTDLHKRYVQLYESFADSWRVIDSNSLFDYAEDNSTDTFTLKSWPREDPDNCLIAGVPIATRVEEAVAKEACNGVTDEVNRENCIFDVRETGNTGFADAYVRTERIQPGVTRTILIQEKEQREYDAILTFTATVQRAVSTVGKVTSGKIQFILDGENTGDATEFDVNREAVWSATSLSRGTHELEARFLPSGFGERFRPSSSTVRFKY